MTSAKGRIRGRPCQMRDVRQEMKDAKMETGDQRVETGDHKREIREGTWERPIRVRGAKSEMGGRPWAVSMMRDGR